MKVRVISIIVKTDCYVLLCQLWLSLLLVTGVMVNLSEAAKGGAKSVINRNRRQRNRGGHGIGINHGDDTVEGGECPCDREHGGAHPAMLKCVSSNVRTKKRSGTWSL